MICINLNGSFFNLFVSKKQFNISSKTNLKRPQMETMQNPREGTISHQILRKIPMQEKNNAINCVAESTESIADKISTQNESPLPPGTIKSKSEDEIFSEMMVKTVEYQEFEKKYLLKLRIQQDIINTRFSINRTGLDAFNFD